MNHVPNEREEIALERPLDGAELEALQKAMLDEVGTTNVTRQIMKLRGLKRHGLYEVALRCAAALNEKYREIADGEGEMLLAAELGHMHRGLGDVDRALEYIDRAYELSRTLRANREQHRYLLLLAMLNKKKQDYRAAMEWAAKSLEVLSDEGEHFRAHSILADCCVSLGDFERGEEHLRAGLDLVTRSGNPRDEAMMLMTMGKLRHGMSDFKGALDALKSAEEICALAGQTEQLLKVQRELLTLARQLGERDLVVGVLTRQMTAAEKGDEAVVPVVMFFLSRELLEFVAAGEPEAAASEMARLFHGLNQFVEVAGEVSTSFLFYLNVVVMLQLWLMGGRDDALEKAQELDEASGGELKLREFLETRAPVLENVEIS